MATPDHRIFPLVPQGDGSAPTYPVTTARTTLSAGISDSATTVPVTSATGLAQDDTILIGDEQMTISSISSLNLTVVRGANGTTATAHANNAPVSEIVATPAYTTLATTERAVFEFGIQPRIEIVNRTAADVVVWSRTVYLDVADGQVVQEIRIGP